MAPLTAFRRWLPASSQVRANSWMLMTGSLGMLCSTLPVQWLLPWLGWRMLFVVLAVLFLLAIVWLWLEVPAWQAVPSPAQERSHQSGGKTTEGLWRAYAPVWRHRYFQRMWPLAFFVYGGMFAMQTLWTGPWLVKVSAYSPLQAATGLFWINVVMLFTFWAWGWAMPRLVRRGWTPNRLISVGLPLNLLALLWLLFQGADTGTLDWAVFFITCSAVAMAQPAIGMAFPDHLAGRALSAYNLLIFAGVFAMQWLYGWLIDMGAALNIAVPARFEMALACLGVSTLGSWLWFLWRKDDNGN
jgi:predicted MFS family arabinose efflux permease